MTTLAESFLAAQTEFPEIGTDSEADAGSFSYTYASLPAITKAVYPVLHKHGFAVSQPLIDGQLLTNLIHKSGEKMTSSMACSAENLNPQDFGKKVTYYRRYALVSMLGLSPDKDVDALGVEATEPASTPPPKRDHLDETVEMLLANKRDLVKAWSPTSDTVAKAHYAVRDLLTTLDADEDELYDAARRAMNSQVDSRNA